MRQIARAGGNIHEEHNTLGGSLSTLEATSQAAALYAALGWPVFPVWGLRDGVCCCGKADCRYPGKHPISGRGMRDATVDAATVGRWWAAHPEANIGLATGAASGIFVVDVDAGAGGLENWSELVGNRAMPPTIESLTGGGGRHLFFLHVAGLRSTTGKLDHGIDTRGEGGYVILPPSSHVSGNVYGWELGAAPGETELAELPGWLLELLQQPRPAQAPTRPRVGAPSANGSHPTTDVERARLYLANLPGGMVDSYADWIAVGLALAELGDAGLVLWDEWSQKSGKYKPGECVQKWATFRPAGAPGTVGLDSLAHWAGMTSAATVPTRAAERAPKKQAATIGAEYPTEAGGAGIVTEIRQADNAVRTESGLWWHFDGGILRALVEPPARGAGTVTATPLPDEPVPAVRVGESTPYKPAVQLVSDLLAQDFPPLVFLVDEILAKGHLAMLGGRPKAGKSWLVLQLAQAIDTGQPFLGRDTRRGRVLYIALEDGARRVHQRCHLIKWQPTPGAAVLFEIARFDGDGVPGPGLAQVEQLAPGYDLIIIDTLISTLSGRASENDNVQMGLLVNELARIAHTSDTAILLCHHTGKGSSENVFDLLRGASALRGAYDVGLLLERKQDEREAILHLESRDVDLTDLTIRQASNGAGWECLGTGQEIKKIRAGRRVVEILQAAGGDELTREEIAAQLAISPQAAGQQLRNAERDGLVSRRQEQREGSLKPVDVWYLANGGVLS